MGCQTVNSQTKKIKMDRCPSDDFGGLQVSAMNGPKVLGLSLLQWDLFVLTSICQRNHASARSNEGNEVHLCSSIWPTFLIHRHDCLQVIKKIPTIANRLSIF